MRSVRLGCERAFVTHGPEKIGKALRLNAMGLDSHTISSRLDVPRGTVRDWLAGRVPRSATIAWAGGCRSCGQLDHRFRDLPASYAYLLGLYLGDGCISRHPRGVYRLRICLDARYPNIVREAGQNMTVILPGSTVGETAHGPNCVEVSSFSKAWPCLLPQHGPGKKHERPIKLLDWQQTLVDEVPGLLLRGLIQSDGCRFINSGRAGWRAPRYSFVNKSSDIREIFCHACDELDLRWTHYTSRGNGTIYVSRLADVELLDFYVGPKT